MAVTVDFWKCDANPKVLDKTTYLKNKKERDCEIYGAFSTLTPSLRLNYDVDLVDYNYARIPGMGYFFMGKPVLLPGHAMSVPLSKDVLMSNMSQIKDLNANILRNENKNIWNRNVYDGMYTPKVTRYCNTIPFEGNVPFLDNYNGQQYNYLLTVIGGGNL